LDSRTQPLKEPKKTMKVCTNVSNLENICSEEQTRPCPDCGETCRAAWVDIGFGPYSQQAGPYRCSNCCWVEPCPYAGDINHCEKCISFDTCFTKIG